MLKAKGHRLRIRSSRFAAYEGFRVFRFIGPPDVIHISGTWLSPSSSFTMHCANGTLRLQRL